MFLNNNIYVITSGPISNNTYIIFGQKKAIIIDPSFARRQIFEILKEKNIKEFDVLITHYHFDHIGRLLEIANKNTNIYIGKAELIYQNKAHAEFFDALIAKSDQYKIHYLEGDLDITIDELKIKCINTPAHTMGSYTYIYENHFFTGDFFFANQIGFFDTANDGKNKFKESVKKTLLYLNEDSIICSGHNRICNWNIVKKENKELSEYYGEEFK